MLNTKTACPDCGTPLNNVHYDLVKVGSCPKCRDTLKSYRKSKKQVIPANLSEFLSITPIKRADVPELPTGTPVWIETYTGTRHVIAAADVILSIVGGTANFLSELTLPMREYNTTWRLWYTFKSFRPTEIDNESYPWFRTSPTRMLGNKEAEKDA